MSASAPRLYLVDGSSYIYRAFFALPPLTSPGGMPTNAVYGFTTMLLKLLADVHPRYLAIVLDAPGRTFRDEIFDDYKANRPAAPPDLTAQMDLVEQVITGFRIRLLRLPDVEADDVIATLTDRFAAQGVDCVVVTGDKDLMQLVGPRVRLWDTMRDRWTDEAAVVERLGVRPDQVLEVMALMGDPVDNIPGVKGVGEKTAVALIRQFGDLETLLARLDEVEELPLRGAKKVARLLREGVENARLSHDLARLRRDLPLELEREDLRFAGPDVAALRELFSRLGFQTLVRQLTAGAPAAAVRVEQLDSPERLAAGLRAAIAGGWLAVATTADSGPPATTAARELLLYGADERPLRIPLGQRDLLQPLRETLTVADCEFIAHDWKRQVVRLAASDVSVAGSGFDLMVASHLLDASATHEISDLAASVLGVRLEGFGETEDGTAAGLTLLPKLREDFAAKLREREMERLFYEVEMPLTHVLARMERRGILLDTERLEKLSCEYAERLATLMSEIHALAGGAFNINSPPQLREVLFERLALSRKGVRRGKTGYSTDVDVLKRLAKEHPLPEKILDYRALAKLKSTYVDPLPAAVNPATGRLHTTFNQAATATGRLSSSDPNLQNIPIRGEEGRRIRAAFVAAPAHVLLAADYSQIELRILAHLSGDPLLVSAFREQQDIHARTAAEVFGVMPGTVTADMRRAAKVINFGILYGMGPQRLAHELAVPVSEAQAYIDSYFERHAGVRAFMQSVIEQGRERGYVSTILGRRRTVPELRSRDRHVVQAAERAAANTPIQGSAADLIKLAMVRVERRLMREQRRAALLLQVHDELLLEAPEGEREAVSELLREEMEGVMQLAVPLRVDLGCGSSWAEAH